MVKFLLFQLPTFYYIFILPKFNYNQASEKGFYYFLIIALIAILALFVAEISIIYFLKVFEFKRLKKLSIPIDNILGRLIEFVDGLPTLMILISLSLVLKPNAAFLILLIGFTSWIGIARFTRAEVLKIRNSDFINAMKIMGMPTWRMFFKHLLPNAIGPALIAFSFGVGSAISFESALSFLGIAIPNDVKTWGMILNESRAYFKAWWLVWSPGICIFLVILSFFNIGQFLKSSLNPEQM